MRALSALEKMVAASERSCAVVGFAVLAFTLFATVKAQSGNVGTACRVTKQLRAKAAVFLAGIALWPALFLLVVDESRVGTGVSIAFVVVMIYLVMEMQPPKNYAGELDGLDGPAEIVLDRGAQVTAGAFALGTLLLSQKDAHLARLVAPLLFLALFLALAPTLAVGQTARRHLTTAPFLSAVQKLSVSFAGGLLCVALAMCLDFT